VEKGEERGGDPNLRKKGVRGEWQQDLLLTPKITLRGKKGGNKKKGEWTFIQKK